MEPSNTPNEPPASVESGDRTRHPSCPAPLLVTSVIGPTAHCLRLDGTGGGWLILPVSELTREPAVGTG